MDSGLSADAAARDSGVCYRTLQRRYDKRDSSATRHGPEPALTMHGEELFAGWLDYCHARGISPTVKRTKKTAKELAEKAGIAGFTASSSWLQGFYRRNPRFATKTAELLEASRRKGVTQEALKPFYDIIWDLLVVKKIPPENIFNLDEAGIELINAMAKVRRPATRPTAILPADVFVAHCRSSRPRSRAGRGCAARDVVQGGIWRPGAHHLRGAADVCDFEERYDEKGRKYLIIRELKAADTALPLAKAWATVCSIRADPHDGHLETAWSAGFRKGGIYPFNRDAITPDLYKRGEPWIQARDELKASRALIHLADPAPPSAAVIDAAAEAVLVHPTLDTLAALRERVDYHAAHQRERGAACLTDNATLNKLINTSRAPQLREEEADAAAKERTQAKADAVAEKEKAAAAAAAQREAAKQVVAERKAAGLPARPKYRIHVDFPPAIHDKYASVEYLMARAGGEKVDFSVLGKRKHAALDADAGAAGHGDGK
jgi:hypothetical protein